ncbi:uncharacterized protein PODANS_7_4880 [Podospora anserina S mat+]|uniref:Podospora anserina S mat+ genomic DNA chromosome 7, supercontig 1 n=1 Tax=Podospora anserina (strain S / ATCC MYA-4624 / DSM 980 / FGSC 10383) TaxID=515849 RepID=B2AUW5_PODAN|nr:uncharacterized protein PODANS_7_4880 [Podospora anserina S mat+]CAP68188.1 unnamed protein product [Podospora anserina S mat+]CDP31658.1 Putative transporter [Podospora anserina S mat+]
MDEKAARQSREQSTSAPATLAAEPPSSGSSASSVGHKREATSSPVGLPPQKSFDSGDDGQSRAIHPDIDHEEAEAADPGHELDVELGRAHGIEDIRRIETRGSVKSKVSRVLSVVSRRKAKERERIPFAPVPVTNLDQGIVGWEGQDDPLMPLNFPNRKKYLILCLLSAITLLTPFASSILAPGITYLNRDFENDNEIVGAMTVSVYLLGYTVGPLFLAPLSEIYGRRVVLSAANWFFCAWQIGCALAPTIESLIVFRFLAGVGGAGCLVSLDLGKDDGRPTVGPVIGGFVSQTIGWRWDFWIVLIISVVVCGLTELFNQETNPRVLIERKVKRLASESGRKDLRSCFETGEQMSQKRILLNGLVRPTKMLFLSPLVFFVSIYIAFTYGTLYLLFTTIPLVFQETYGWSIGITGLIYICLGIGNMCGWAVVTATSDKGVHVAAHHLLLVRLDDTLSHALDRASYCPVPFFVWNHWNLHPSDDIPHRLLSNIRCISYSSQHGRPQLGRDVASTCRAVHVRESWIGLGQFVTWVHLHSHDSRTAIARQVWGKVEKDGPPVVDQEFWVTISLRARFRQVGRWLQRCWVALLYMPVLHLEEFRLPVGC